MSHEIRTPMNGVLGMTDLLLETPLRAEQRDFAETIRHSAEALLSVLNDILDFSKVEAGKLQLEAIDFDLVELVEESLELLTPKAEGKGIEIGALIDPHLPTHFHGDPVRIRQVLINLLGNALKFTESGEVMVFLESQERPTSNGRPWLLRIAVTDTGIGIPEDARAELFEAFAQGDRATNRKYGGTGLGLAISRQIVELMGGEIDFESKPGEGSTFWFSLSMMAAESGSAMASKAEIESKVAGTRILLADARECSRKVFSHHADAWGIKLEMASNALEALATLKSMKESVQPPAIVFVDLSLPERGGLDFMVKAQDVCPPATGFVLLTSQERRFTAESASRLGLHATLAQPLRREMLLNTILETKGRVVRPGTTPPLLPHRAGTTPPMDGSVSSLRVLIAEDIVVNQKIALLQLQKLGLKADCVANGREVLESLDRKKYDLILMDCQMPEMDGYEATRRIRRLPKRSDVYIVAMTANAMHGDEEKCLSAGMDAYLAKPLRADSIAAAIDDYFEARRQRGPRKPE